MFKMLTIDKITFADFAIRRKNKTDMNDQK